MENNTTFDYEQEEKQLPSKEEILQNEDEVYTKQSTIFNCICGVDNSSSFEIYIYKRADA